MSNVRNDILLRHIAVVLKGFRVAENLTQSEVYHDTGIHIGRIESFKIDITVSTLLAICNYYGVSLTDFFRKVEGVS